MAIKESDSVDSFIECNCPLEIPSRIIRNDSCNTNKTSDDDVDSTDLSIVDSGSWDFVTEVGYNTSIKSIETYDESALKPDGSKIKPEMKCDPSSGSGASAIKHSLSVTPSSLCLNRLSKAVAEANTKTDRKVIVVNGGANATAPLDNAQPGGDKDQMAHTQETREPNKAKVWATNGHFLFFMELLLTFGLLFCLTNNISCRNEEIALRHEIKHMKTEVNHLRADLQNQERATTEERELVERDRDKWKDDASSCHEDLVNATAHLDPIYEQLLSSKGEKSKLEKEKKELQSVLQDLGAEQTWKDEASSCHEDLVNATARLDLIYEQLLSSKGEKSKLEKEKKELLRVLQDLRAELQNQERATTEERELIEKDSGKWKDEASSCQKKTTDLTVYRDEWHENLLSSKEEKTKVEKEKKEMKKVIQAERDPGGLIAFALAFFLSTIFFWMLVVTESGQGLDEFLRCKFESAVQFLTLFTMGLLIWVGSDRPVS